MENFVDSDETKMNKYYADKLNALKMRYGVRIQQIMMVPLVQHITKKYKGNKAAQIALGIKEAAGATTAVKDLLD